MAHREPILAEWEAFARTCAPASTGMDVAALRDHAGRMLTVIAADLDVPQGGDAQAEKSKGRGPAVSPDLTTAAEEHGAVRAESGFSVEQMVAEYRALRASVTRLWALERAGGGPTTAALAWTALEDLTRFNEAIDQALAESVTRYTQDLDESKEMFLAILGHDLRTPLGASLMASRFMLDTGELVEPHATLTARIASSSTRMLQLIGDLLDFTRSRLGGGIPIVRADLNVGKVVHDVVDELAAAHPHRTLTVDAHNARRAPVPRPPTSAFHIRPAARVRLARAGRVPAGRTRPGRGGPPDQRRASRSRCRPVSPRLPASRCDGERPARPPAR